MSSSTDNPYDSFGRILSEGGEMAVATALARGYSSDKIGAIMLKKFGQDWNSGGGLVLAYSAAMVTAGRAATERIQTGGTISDSEIPSNPYADSEEWEGGRYRWSADVQFEGATTSVTVYGYSTTANPVSIEDFAIEGGYDVVDNYRKKFGLKDTDNLTPVSVKINSIERSA